MFGHVATEGVRQGLLQTSACNLIEIFPTAKAKRTARPAPQTQQAPAASKKS